MSARTMTWKEMVDKYPKKWLALKNYKMEGSDIVSGDLVAVLQDTEIIEYQDKNFGKGYYYIRTAMEENIGIINV